MKKLILILCLCLCSTAVFCDALVNDGRWWNKANRGSKLDFIIGFSEAYTRGAAVTYAIERTFTKKPKEKENPYDHFPYKYNYGEIIDFVDDFYSNSQYRTLRLETVLTLIIFPALKQSWSKEEIDKKALLYLKIGDIVYMIE